MNGREPHRLQLQEILNELFAVGGKDGLWVELDAFDGELAMAETHDRAAPIGAGGAGRNLEFIRQRIFFDDERMIPGTGHGAGDSGKDGFTVMFDLAGLAVHELRCADDVASEGCADSLMAEADSEDWSLPAKRWIRGMRMPASCGVQGPGDSTSRSGARASTSSTLSSRCGG